MVMDEGSRLQLMRLDAENERMLFGGVLDDDADFAFGVVGNVAITETPALEQRTLVHGSDGGRRRVWKHEGAVQGLVTAGALTENEWVERPAGKSLLDDY